MSALVFVPLALIAAGFWVLRCNDRTFKDRSRIADEAVFRFDGTSDWMLWLPKYRAVTYEDHLYALCLFRDPWALYDPALIARMKACEVTA